MYTKEELEEKRPKELVQIIMDMQNSLDATQKNQLSEEMVQEILRVILDPSVRPLGMLYRILNIIDYG